MMLILRQSVEVLLIMQILTQSVCSDQTKHLKSNIDQTTWEGHSHNTGVFTVTRLVRGHNSLVYPKGPIHI